MLLFGFLATFGFLLVSDQLGFDGMWVWQVWLGLGIVAASQVVPVGSAGAQDAHGPGDGELEVYNEKENRDKQG